MSSRHLVLILVTFALLFTPTFEYDLPPHRYRFDVTLVALSITHLDTELVIDTYSLSLSEDLRSDCSDLVFVTSDDPKTELNWFIETSCPGTALSPYTTIWISVPLLAQTIFMYFGDGNSHLSSSLQNEGRLFWDTDGREIRLYGGGTECTPPSFVRSQWSLNYVSIAGSVASCCSEIRPEHSHELRNQNIDLGIMAEGIFVPSGNDDICGVLSGAERATPTDHTHPPEPTSIKVVQTEVVEMSRPDSVVLRPCVVPPPAGLSGNVRGKFMVENLVAMFQSRREPTSGNWTYHAGSQDRFVKFGDPSFEDAQTHTHSVSASMMDFDFLDSEAQVDDLDLGTGDQAITAWDHSHGIQMLTWVNNEETPGIPDHYLVHLYARQTGAVFPIAKSSDWVRQNEAEGMVHIFDVDIPPLGFELVPNVQAGHLLRVLPVGSMQPAFDDRIAGSDHSHPIAPGAGRSDQIFTSFVAHRKMAEATQPCSLTWANGKSPTWGSAPGHNHEVHGASEPQGCLPRHVPVLLAYRFEPERVFVKVPDVGGPDGPGVETPLAMYIGIGVGAGSGAIGIILLIFVVIVIAMCCALRKKNELIPDASDVAINQAMRDDTRDSMAQIRIDSALFEIDFESVKVKKKIGSGGSSAVVFKATWQKEEVAFKVFQLHEFLAGGGQFSEFEKEVQFVHFSNSLTLGDRILASLSHPNILRFYGATVKPPRVGIVMEYCPNGDVQDFLIRSEDFPMKGRLLLLCDTASALAFLHDHDIIHRDVKSCNVLVDSKYRGKLMDFGLSRSIQTTSDSMKKTVRVGTSQYMAPEVATSGEYAEPVDVYSLAIMIFEVCTGNFEPYGAQSVNVELRAANDSDFRPKFRNQREEKAIPRAVVELMGFMWAQNPAHRPLMAHVASVLEKVLGGMM